MYRRPKHIHTATMLSSVACALLTTACGGGDSVTAPRPDTPPAPPPPPPLTATMLPGSALVEVGNSVVFAVNASGGAAGAGASWTCASSNTGIATVSNAAAGCQATGVAAGGVTITAAVTKGGETVNVGAQLVVTSPPTPPLVVTVTPQSTTVAVGGTADFVLDISGGNESADPRWTCSSSDPAIATVEATDLGCRARGAGPGGAVITVAVTRGSESVNLAAQVTVNPPSLTATMTPVSATVSAGESVDLAVSTDGGDPGVPPSWTCVSSNPGIATVAVTDTGCRVTGVAAGEATITATVTRGSGSTADATAQVTVPDLPPPGSSPTHPAGIDEPVTVTTDGLFGGRAQIRLTLLEHISGGPALAIVRASFPFATDPPPGHEYTCYRNSASRCWINSSQNHTT